MSTSDLKHPSGAPAYRITIHRDKAREGRHGPLFCAADATTATLLAGERLDMDGPALELALSRLQQRPDHELDEDDSVVAYRGYYREEGHAYLLTDAFIGHTVMGAIQSIEGPLALDFTCPVLRGIIRGLEKLYTDRGLTVVFLDANHIWLPMNGIPMIESPILDITVTGQPFRPSVLTIPEIVFGPGRGNLRKADVWLLGIVAAMMLSGRLDLVADYAAATAVGSQILKQGPTGSALAILLPDHDEILADKPLALDFLRKCLAVNSDERPSAAELRNHPFLGVAK